MRIIIFTSLLGLLAAPVYGHQCILSGTDSSQIAIYNACKSDIVMGLDGHDLSSKDTTSENESATQRLILLEAENRQMQAKLKSLRNRLLELMKDL
jgi:hypothetical protein